MTFSFVNRLVNVARSRGRALHGCLRKPLPGRFQTYNHTLPDRYPWLFSFAAAQLAQHQNLHLLSFGCSLGDEVFALRSYFPDATLRGIDVDPGNIAACTKRARTRQLVNATFTTAASTREEPTSGYDAIFCLAVLCLGDLTVSRRERCDPDLRFEDFDAVVTDFSRCLKPGGYLWLHTANFRFGDTTVSRQFDVVLEAEPDQMASDLQFGRDNRLATGDRSRAVGFRKHK